MNNQNVAYEEDYRGYYPDHDDKHDYDACLREAKQYIRSLK